MKERRTTYRVTPAPPSVRVSLAPRGREPVAGALRDLSARGVSVAVAAAKLPALPIGTSVELSFDIDDIDPIEGILAVVRAERDSGDERVFGLEIIDWRTLVDRLPPKLLTAFNRRTHFRVELPREPATEAAVSMTESGQTLTATLANISSGGCLLLFRPEEAPEAGDVLQVAFSLPGSNHRYDLLATVRSASEFRDAVRCGLEFDDVRSEGFTSQQAQLSQYVMKRQRELRGSG